MITRTVTADAADPDLDPACSECSGELIGTSVTYPCRTAKLLALPYADHPQFQPEWRI